MLAIAAFADSTSPRIVDHPSPAQPGVGEVLCRTLELGVCGTDREILHSARPAIPAGEEYLVLGHECLARIEAVGEGVSDWSVGDLAVPAVRRALPGSSRRVDMLPLGCFTERGIFDEHGFSSPLWLDRPEYLYRVPNAIASVAVLAEPVAVTEKGASEALLLQRARLGERAWLDVPPRVLVTGQGPIGFAAIISCVARSWPVTVYGRDDRNTFRSQLAVTLGASYLPADEANLNPDNVERDGFDLILECTGSDSVMLASAGALASCGVMVWLGSSRTAKPATHNLARLMRDGLMRNHLHVGCVNAAPRDFQAALAHLSEINRSHPSELAALITARVRPEESLWHYEHRQQQGIKTVLMYE